jgi:hypothetical protein
MIFETKEELHALLLCQAWRREMVLALNCAPDVLDVSACDP